MQGLVFLIPLVGVAAACVALGVSRASYYRAQKPVAPRRPRPRPARALTDEERAQVLAVLDSEPFVDLAPAQVYAKLLEDGVYLCSRRTMHRVLAAEGQTRERRAQRRHPVYTKPQLVATAPNQVWSWDTTKLPGPTKGTYYTLYVILDIFSRYIVGWLVTERESAAAAQELIAACCRDQGIAAEQLTVHADRGSPMVAKSTAQLYLDLGVAKSHSRPHTSNDNPYSESNFRTLKYRPEMPTQLGSLQDARQVVRGLVDWYNRDHYHEGIALLHPVDVHYGRTEVIVAARQRVLDDAHRRHPERFVRGQPTQKNPPPAAWIKETVGAAVLSRLFALTGSRVRVGSLCIRCRARSRVLAHVASSIRDREVDRDHIRVELANRAKNIAELRVAHVGADLRVIDSSRAWFCASASRDRVRAACRARSAGQEIGEYKAIALHDLA